VIGDPTSAAPSLQQNIEELRRLIDEPSSPDRMVCIKELLKEIDRNS
jgi:hypothetical protein